MKHHAFVAASLVVAIGSGATLAADSSPQPTTSPTNSGKTSPKTASSAELAQFVEARSAIGTRILEFNELVSKGKSRVNPKEIKYLAKEINRLANAILRHARTTNNLAAEKLASQLIIDDDVTGRQAAWDATASRLMELDTKLSLLHPVVHR